MAESVRVRLIGGFSVSRGDRLVDPRTWRLRKARTLVKLLALQPAHTLHRDRVVDLLWPETDPDAARNNLHQIVFAARRALATLGVDGTSVLAMHDDALMLGGAVTVVTDLEELDAAVEAARAAGRPADVIQALRERTGELLPEDAYEPWVQAAAGSFRARRTQLVMDVVDDLLDAGEGDTAVALLAPVVGSDPLNEAATRAMMRSLVVAGRRSEALVAYERLVELLRDELAADPEPQTRQLFRDLLSAEPVTLPTPRGAGSLPAPLVEMVGRARELAETARILSRTRLLTLTGMGGAGKTTLAIELARQCATDFAGDVHLVELSALTRGDQVPAQLARTLHLDLPADAPPVESLVAQLGRRRALVVLDNCEHLLDACARAVSELLRGCPSLKVLATSREALLVDGEVTWRTPSLALPDPAAPADVTELAGVAAVELFVRRASAASPSFALTAGNAAAVAEICYRLDGIPLALELAAGCIPVLSPRQIADRLGDALVLLRRGGRASVTRQQTLAATMEWSHDLLDQDEQVVFRRLSVFAGSFSMEAVEAVCGEGLDQRRVLDAVRRLVDTSLLSTEPRADEVRYRLLDTVRQYAAERLRAGGETEDLARRHADWFRRVVLQHSDGSGAGLGPTAAWSLDAEHDNVRVALGWSLQRDAPAALEIACAMSSYWLTRGLFAEGRRWVELALDGAPAATALRSRALVALAVFDVRRGSIERLNALGREAVDIHRGLGDPTGLAHALNADAVLLFMAGDWNGCWERSLEVATVAGRSDAPELAAAARHLQAVVLASRHQLVEAQVAFDEVRSMLDRVPPSAPPFLAPLQLGFMVEGHTTGAPRVYFEETVLPGRLVGPEAGVGYVLCNLADVARMSGRLDDVPALLADAATCFASIGDRTGEALVLSRRGCLHRIRGEYDESRESLSASLRLRRAIGDRRATGLNEASLGVLAAEAGDVDAGVELLLEAAESFREIQDVAATVGVSLTLASVDADVDELDTAAKLLASALASSAGIPGNHRATAWGHLMLADVLRRLGRGDEAEAALATAYGLFDELAVPRVVDLREPNADLQSRR